MKSYEELRDLLWNGHEIRQEHGIEFQYKKSPDTEEGYLDQREAVCAHVTLEELEKNPEQYPVNILENKNMLFPEPVPDDIYTFQGIPVGMMRKNMGWKNIDLSSHITSEDMFTDARVPLRVYMPEDRREDRPCLIFIHGGGFVGGSVEVVENPCKDIAGKADAVVVSVDYRLAPEHPFPQGLDDCYDALCWVYSNSGRLGVDREKIGIAGDSAGGNLAAACTLRDRDEGRGMVHYQALLYAALMLHGTEGHEDYRWSIDMYQNKAADSLIVDAVTWIKETQPVLDITYAQGGGKDSSYLSPADAGDFAGLPKTLIVTAEYDYLRAECDLYTKYLQEAGVSVRNIRYGGVRHAFLDKYGLYPQAEDCVMEMVKDLSGLGAEGRSHTDLKKGGSQI